MAREAAEQVARLSSRSTLSQLSMQLAWSLRTSGVMLRSAQRKAEPSSCFPERAVALHAFALARFQQRH
jgi:hypothetical protein